MIEDILMALGFCLFIWIVYVGAVKLFTDEWLWVMWKKRRKREKDLKRYMRDKE